MYEKLRTLFSESLLNYYSLDDTNQILSCLDVLAEKFEIKERSTELSIIEGIPTIIKSYAAAKIIENKRPKTIDSYVRILRNFLLNVGKPYNRIEKNDVRTYLFKYKKDRSVKNSSLDTIRSVICGFLHWLENEGLVEYSGSIIVTPIKHEPSERQALTPLQLELIRNACKTLREKALIDLMYSTGCRVSEVSDLKIEDVDIKEQTVIIKHGKGDKRRITYLNAESVVSLTKYLESRTDTCEYLFVSSRGNTHKLSSKSIQNSISAIIERTDMKIHVTPHIFRHTAATIALRSGMPIEQVQKFMGHENINTTMIYVKTDDLDVKLNHQKFVS